MQIFVKIIQFQKTITIDCIPEDSVEDLNTKILCKTGLNPLRFYLISNGKILMDGQKLSIYGIQKESNVFLAFRPC